MIRLKRIYEQPEPSDGRRILVDRIWPRGVSKQDACLDQWMKELAPSSELRKLFCHDPERFDEFAHRYRQEIERDDTRRQLFSQLKEWSAHEVVTLVYAAKDQEHNQAVVLRNLLEES